MFYDFSVTEAKQIFNINTDGDFDKFHNYVEGLMIAYCAGTKQSLEDFTDVSYSQVQSDNQIVNLVRNNIRIPTSWEEKDIDALHALLVDINFHSEASRLYDS